MYDANLNRCTERPYKYSAEYIGPVGAIKEVDIEQCDKLIGYDPETYIKVYDYLEKQRRRDRNKRKR